MKKAVMISIQPKWVELIAAKKKTVEIRKTRPNLDTPFKCYIYCTLSGSKEFFEEACRGDVASWNRSKMSYKKGHVIGEFVCDRIFPIQLTEEGYDYESEKETRLRYEEMSSYLNFRNGYGWHISDLVIYDQPMNVSEFMKPCNQELDGIPLCLQCKRLVENYGCGGTIIHPPQSWCYVESLE